MSEYQQPVCPICNSYQNPTCTECGKRTKYVGEEDGHGLYVCEDCELMFVIDGETHELESIYEVEESDSTERGEGSN